MVKNFHHHWRAYGGWSFVMEVKFNRNCYFRICNFLQDYYGEGIFAHLDDPAFEEARKTHVKGLRVEVL